VNAFLWAAVLVGGLAAAPQTGYWKGSVPEEKLKSLMTYAAELSSESISSGARTLRVTKYPNGRQTVYLSRSNWLCAVPSFVGCLSGGVELKLRVESDGSAMAFTDPIREDPVEELAKGALGEFMFWTSPKRP
jgi:hypothetical protein